MDPRANTPASPRNNHSQPPRPSYRQPNQQMPGSQQRPQTTSRNTAAIDLARQQVDRLYSNGTPSNQPLPATPNVYNRTLKDKASDVNAEQWRKYHSSWQNYYQNYYEQYYVREMRRTLEKQSSQGHSEPKNKHTLTDSVDTANEDTTSPQTKERGALTQKEALDELRQNIRDKAQTTAKKARKSRHFVPIASALTVVGVFALLQYNQILVANVKAYVSPANVQPENIIVDPNSDVPVGPENKMIIPKINVDAPIVMNVGPTNADQMKAMADGIAHVKYPGATSVPGQIGNTVFSAHSSSDWLDTGKYKFIFVQLERLAKGDVVYINYESKQYAYKVFETKVVSPTNTSALRYTGKDPIITLITCVPLGTAQNRLLVSAKQISPSPSSASKAPAKDDTSVQDSGQMAGTPPTFLERIFGAK